MKTTIAWYALAIVLVVAYVNTFAVWQLLQLRLGDAAALVPWLIVVALSVAAVAMLYRPSRRRDVSASLIWIAVSVAFVGMLIADPAFPAKRIHVPQYAILAAVIWFALRKNVDPDRTALYTIVITGLFGVHDEFLQGLHPDRTFGARDLAVNLSGAIAGTLVLAGASGQRVVARGTVPFTPAVLAGTALAAIGLGLFVVASVSVRAQLFPYWSTLPLLAGTFAFAWALARGGNPADAQHAGAVTVLLLVALCCYPVIANETSLVFA